jgi:hypothetical protein
MIVIDDQDIRYLAERRQTVTKTEASTLWWIDTFSFVCIAEYWVALAIILHQM